MPTIKDVLANLSIARTEFRVSNSSVLSSFVKPPFFEQINILNYEHSIALVGGRGSGKTMYLRYFSHWTQFGKGVKPDRNDLKDVVLYWKPDTIFSRAIERRKLDPNLADLLFEYLISIEITKELVGLIQNVANHFVEEAEETKLKEGMTNIINRIYKTDISSIEDMSFELDLLFSDIYGCVLSGKPCMPIIASTSIKNILNKLRCYSLFKETSFKIYIDEFENFTLNQQAFINALRKHSDNLISWNVAYKAYASISNYVAVSDDLESEQLQKQNDYREVNIDKIIEDSDEVAVSSFFAKILLVTIDKENYSTISFNDACSIVRKMLIQKNIDDLIRSYINNNSGFSIRLLNILNNSGINLDKNLINRVAMEPSLAIALVAIKDQKTFDLNTLNKYLINTLNKTEQRKLEEKIRHYAPSGIYKLNIMSAYNNIPIYSGFDRFIKLSSLNVRHFLELCYQTFLLHLNAEDGKKELELTDLYDIPDSTMHKAAKITSNKLLSEIPSFAPMGQRLNIVVQRLGEVFRISHQQNPITEPEINHFGINTDSLDSEIQKILNQALCWNVLIQLKVTKEKNNIDTNKYDYQLNPIYAPAFDISYRKMHKQKLSSQELQLLFSGSNEDWIKYRNIKEKGSNKDSSQPLIQVELFE